MLVTTSATTVPTVTYLSLQELESYKKQFQSFWIPFMEQFIPATTIWVAGERWCNDPCPVINPCDYDFELVESDVSLQFYSGNPRSVSITGFVSATLSSTTINGNSLGTPVGITPVTSTQRIITISDLGYSRTRPIIRTQEQAEVNISTYRDKFTRTTKETIVL